jgi:hypothetical protein
MTVEDYRELTLSLPEAIESSHMDHPDFRVRGKIFATIRSATKGEGVVKLTPAQQNSFAKEKPTVFAVVAGGWGRKGWTIVHFARADRGSLQRALVTAWRNVAPKRLVAQFQAKI